MDTVRPRPIRALNTTEPESCERVRDGEMRGISLAREKITAGAQVAIDAARQYLAYLDQLEPVVAQQVATLCTGAGPGA